MQHLVNLNSSRLMLRQRRTRNKRAAQTTRRLLDPAVAQPMTTSEDYENLRARLSFENAGRSSSGPGQWLSGEEAVMGREGDGRRGGAQKDMWAMARGPWRFAARGIPALHGAEERRDVGAAADAGGEDGWEVLELGDARGGMDSGVEAAGGAPRADAWKGAAVRKGGKGVRAVWV